jgi:hypothetical protein
MQTGAQTSSQTSIQFNSALRVLYGRWPVSQGSLDSLGLDEIKSTFRQRTMELHPDRASILGRDPVVLNKQFKDVKLAYETLRELLTSGKIPMTMIMEQDRSPQPADPPPPSYGAKKAGSNGNYKQKTRPGNGHRTGGRSNSYWEPQKERPTEPKMSSEQAEPSDHYWEAEIPTNRLLFGQFLYYAGLVSWQTLISAITWQRGQRPPFGRIAKMWDYLTDDEIRRIIEFRDRGERIGESALRQGLLSQFQFNAVMGFQKWMQRPIGEYFQEIGILEDEEIQYLVGLLKKHNFKIERMRPFD